MKYLAIAICAIALTITVQGAPRNAIIEQGIVNTLQEIREQMPCGFPERDMRPLAPYINNDGIAIDWQFPSIQLVGTLTALRVDGADNFIDERVSFDLPSMVMLIDFLHPQLTFQGTFNAAGTVISQDCQIAGAGSFQLTAFNLWHNTTSQLGLRIGTEGFLNMDEMISVVRLGSVSVNVDSFVGGAAVTQQCNQLVQQNLPALIEANEYQINEILSEILVTAANYDLNQMTIMDLFNLINNPSTRPPCVA